MTFSTKNLSVLGYANGFTLWHYATVDTAAEVDTTGYFSAASPMLRVGDFILANTDTDGASPSNGIMVVRQNDTDGVDVTDLTTMNANMD